MNITATISDPVQASIDATHLTAIRAWLLDYCRLLGGTHQDCEDIVQETMLRTLPVMMGEVRHPNWRGYMCQIARNLWIDQVRRRRTSQKYLGTIRQGLTSTMPIGVDFLQLEDAMYALLQQVSPRQCTVWLLREVYQYPTREVAQMLRLSEAAVKSTLHRARAQVEAVRKRDFSVDSVDTEEALQRELATAYTAALRSANVQQLLALADGAGISSLQATVQAIRLASERTDSRTDRREVADLAVRPMSMAA